MVFNSLAFLVFFLLFFYLYWFTERKTSINWRNLLLIVGSYIFYGWWDWRFLGLIVISSAADYILGLQIHKAESPKQRKFFLILSLCINLGILGFFKYFNFFTESFAELITLFGFQANPSSLDIILPVGISFYTFQTMSYAIDIYRRQLTPTKNALQFFAFVSFFPQLVAGPIERASRFLPQFAEKKTFDYSKTVSGLRLMLWGFFKKIVIADNFAVLVEQIFDNPTEYSGIGILMGSVLFAFQIYCDFSGYSDIAIGLGKTMGFDLMTNFNKPYFSRSFGEFWSRWHISLSTWFRDYVYIPLGGNRVSKARRNLNLMATFLLSGLWHGANFTFLIWGFLHGLMLIIEKKVKWAGPMAAPFVFVLCCLFWIPFRAESMAHLGVLTTQLISIDAIRILPELIHSDLLRYSAIVVVFVFFMILEKRMKDLNFSEYVRGFSKTTRISFYYALLLCILLLGNFDVKPSFIYFQF